MVTEMKDSLFDSKFCLIYLAISCVTTPNYCVRTGTPTNECFGMMYHWGARPLDLAKVESRVKAGKTLSFPWHSQT